MPAQIQCPHPNDNVQVRAQGSGSGAPGTICVRGTIPVTGPRPTTQALAVGQFVRVRIERGFVQVGSLGQPTPVLGGDYDAPIIGTDWCAPNIPVPSWSSAGDPMTAVAWLGTQSGSGSPTFSAPDSVPFNAGGPNPTDCCSSCMSGSGVLHLAAYGELAASPDLDVTVADGANAGTFKANAVANLQWKVTVDKVSYTLALGSALVIEGPSGYAVASLVACDPFSANFPGAILGAASDVVVTLA